MCRLLMAKIFLKGERMMKVNEIRTRSKGVKVADKIVVDEKPMALVKNGKRVDVMSLDEFASQLYGCRVRCNVEEVHV